MVSGTRNTVLTAAALVLALSAPLAGAAQKKQPAAAKPAAQPVSAAKTGVGKGDMEIGVFANYSQIDDSGGKTLLVGAAIGSFVSDNLAIRVAPAITWTDFGDTTSFFFIPQFTMEYLFRIGQVAPYVGGGFGLNIGYTDLPADYMTTLGVFLAPVTGVKWFFDERMSVEYALSYQVGVAQIYTSLDDFSADTRTLQQTVRFNLYY